METPLLESILEHAMSLGISGLLFVMWWHERRERLSSASSGADLQRDRAFLGETTGNLVNVVRGNTEALAALREELRSHRQAEAQWLEALFEQMRELRDERS